MNQVAAVVVTYNRLELLKECLEKLLSQTSPCDVLIVDNASSDGTEAYIKTAYADNARIQYRNTGANIGGAGGFNFGMRWAVEAGYEFVWVMDDDCMPREDALEKLLDADRILQGNYGWLSSVVLWKDGRECKMNRQKLKKHFFDFIEYMQYGIVQAEQATFVSLFLKAKTVIDFGLPIKEFFIWGDDIEYTRRISVRNSIPSFVVGKSIVIHKMQNNNGSNIATDDISRINRYKYAYRNENFLYRQEGIKGMAYYLAKCGYHTLLVIQKQNSKKLERCKVIVLNNIKGIFFNPKIERVDIHA